MSLRPRSSLVASLVLVVPLWVASCTSVPTEEFDLSGPKPDGGGRCTPGETQDCICLGGGQGIQTCRASGSSFGSCTGCSTGTDGPAPVITDMGGSACGDCDGNSLPFAPEVSASAVLTYRTPIASGEGFVTTEAVYRSKMYGGPDNIPDATVDSWNEFNFRLGYRSATNWYATLWVENAFDELENHWGWSGFTTRDLKRCRLMARAHSGW